MMDLALWPYVKTESGDWSIPNEIMIAVWNSMIEHDRVRQTFYDGAVITAEQFADYIRNPKNFPVLVVDNEDMSLVLLAWLNNVDDGVAYAHFSFLSKFSREGMKKVLKYWSYMPIDVIIGVTPESYTTLIKVFEHCGLKVVGTIPKMCNMVYENRKEGGVISYYETGGEHGKEIRRVESRSEPL